MNPNSKDMIADQDHAGMHGPSPILGPDGLPAQRSLSLKEKQELAEEVAHPELIGTRIFWDPSVASGLTPQKLAQLLRGSIRGDVRYYLELAEEMEERDPHYFSVLGTRKRALTQIKPSVEPASKSPQDAAIAAEVEALAAEPAFRDMLRDLVDAFGKGFSCVEILWAERAGKWVPGGYIWRDPKYFTFDYISRSELRLADFTTIDGVALPPAKFIRHLPKLKSGIPIRAGLARIAAWSYCFKNYSIKDWAAFLDVFGMPIRVGKYHPSATPEERRKLLQAVASIAVDAAAIIPESMMIEFIEAKSTGQVTFEGMARYCDEQVSKAVLGQTMSTDGHAGGLAQAKVHNQVRIDIMDDDADQLSATLNRDLVEWYVRLNYGDSTKAPRLVFPVAEPEDIAVLAGALAALVPLGLKVSQQHVREKIGVREPMEGEECLTPPVAPAPKDPNVINDASKSALNRSHAPGCPCGCGLSLNAESAATEPDVIDRIGADEADDWEPQLSPFIGAIRKAAAKASSYEEFIAALDELAATFDMTPLARRLMISAMKARGFGEGSGPNGRLDG
jgi:phage gp29-like protein